MSEWKKYDNKGWPKGVGPFDVLALRMENGDVVIGVECRYVDWGHSNAVVYYKITQKGE